MRRSEAGIQVDKFYPPTDWLDNDSKQIDIRKNAENNSIVLLVGHSADFTKYSLLGILADTSSGTYDVYIDSVLVGSGVTKNTQYDIDFSTINTSYGSATTPESLVLHKVVIKPTTSGSTITVFHCARTTGATGIQYNGILWCHFELSNRFSLNQAFASDTDTYRSSRMRAITAQNNLLKPTSLYNSFYRCTALIYIPIIDGIGNPYNIYRFVYNCPNLKRICFRDFNNNSNSTTSFASCSVLEQIQCNNSEIGIAREGFDSLYSLKLIPNKKIYSLQQSVTNATSLQPTKIDASSYTALTKIGLYGTSTYPMRGLRGLKVSNEAPFSGSSPQINVSYTGLDRDALRELFTSLPTVTGGQTLNCVACSGNNLTKVGSPTIDENGVVSGFSSSNYFSISGISTADKQKTRKSFELKVKVTLPSTLTNSQIVYYPNRGQSGLKLNSNGTITFLIYSSGTTVYQIDSTTVFSANETVYVKTVINNNLAKLFTSYDGNSWNLENSLDLTDMPSDVTTDNYSRIGVSGESTPLTYFAGIIFLEETYVKVEQNYLMKGYLTDADKNIALNKGWSLTLS